jgi:hypothetical protein
MFYCLFLGMVNGVVPQPRVKGAVPSKDLNYVASGPGLLGDVVPWALGCTHLGSKMATQSPLLASSQPPAGRSYKIDFKNMAVVTLDMELSQLPGQVCVFLYVNIQ